MIEMLPVASIPESSVSQLPVILLEDGENDFICADFLPVTTVFGGFKTWPRSKSDFVLIAECSEISGPNPIFTIPVKQHLVKNLNALCVRLLSTDYQEFGSSKAVPTVDAQVLLPDIMSNVHAAVYHFTLYDAEARGFVRPFCLAYVTADKYKLLQVSEAVFKSLAEAASVIQHSNRKFCVGGLEKLMLDLELTKSTLSTHSNLQNKCDNPAERLKVYNRLIESCMKDIQQILTSVECREENKDVDRVIEDLAHRLNQRFSSLNLLMHKQESEEDTYSPKQLKIPLQQNFDKHLKNLYHLSPGGILLSVYHLYLIHKHFKRKYANIASCSNTAESFKSNCLYFGACMRVSSCEGVSAVDQECSINLPMTWKQHKFSDSTYFDDFSVQSVKVISDFLENQKIFSNTDSCLLVGNEDMNGSSKSTDSCSDHQTVPNGIENHHDAARCENDERKFSHSLPCSNHIVLLNEIWDVIDHIKHYISDIECIALEVLRLVNQNESLLYSLLTRNLIVVLFSIDEEFIARVFLQFLAVLIPRNFQESIFVEHNRKKPLLTEDLKSIVAVSYRLPFEASEMIPSGIKSSMVILNLSEAKYQGPRYTGCLLQDLNANIKKLSIKDSIFPFFISILAEINLQLELWLEINTSSPSSSISAVYLLQREFTRCDIRIIETLSKICAKSSNAT